MTGVMLAIAAFLTDALAEWQCEPSVCVSACVSHTARDIPWPFLATYALPRVWQCVMSRGQKDGETA